MIGAPCAAAAKTTSNQGSSAATLPLAPDAFLLPGFGAAAAAALTADIAQIEAAAPFRHLQTPGGFRMSVAMTNCGSRGWVSDRRGYRYADVDPRSGLPWPPLSPTWLALAQSAARTAGFDDFVPDACLVNRYAVGARMSLHQDKDERDFAWPIVSMSLGLPAVFLLGGHARSDKPRRVALQHGDAVVFGGSARLRYHGIAPVKAGRHSLCGEYRFNLTFRRAG